MNNFIQFNLNMLNLFVIIFKLIFLCFSNFCIFIFPGGRGWGGGGREGGGGYFSTTGKVY